MPADVAPENVATQNSSVQPDIDDSWLAIVSNWRLVVAELALRGIDLYADDVRARPWPGIRTLIFALIEQPNALRRALTRR
ncbi:hypothetical protein QE428_002594 [Microbacterium sp. SORGH_AS 505]|uniref:Uncharacterized protein n=1 Tax=Microbacterium oleivorans TaxID=273677 RepID=A0A4R5YFB4_9MICO|nr:MULTISPECIES: hypothetical protein [Microbacterium]MDQ1127561.1 hypothetical protein [Microbacterium sp. SORGH_AS_0505]TDL43831.1 hypothetical protein E2R54_11620 [Microbacterium oleivorans]